MTENRIKLLKKQLDSMYKLLSEYEVLQKTESYTKKKDIADLNKQIIEVQKELKELQDKEQIPPKIIQHNISGNNNIVINGVDAKITINNKTIPTKSKDKDGKDNATT